MKKLPRPSLDSISPVVGGHRCPHRRRSPIWQSATTGLFIGAAVASATVIPTEWTHRQAVIVAAPGLVKIAVPAAAFDVAQPGLADLRLLEANGTETAHLIDRDLSVHGQLPPWEQTKPVRPRSYRATTTSEGTQLLIETGSAELPESMTLETAAPYFLKAAHVEISTDGETWESTGPAVPVFRQFGAEQLRLALPRRAASFVRVMLDDFRSRRMAFTGASLQPRPARAAPPTLVPVGATITRRDEFAGETVLTVTLDGRHVPLGEIVFATQDPLFMRRVTVTHREVRGDVSGERLVAAGTLYRVALEGAPVSAQLAVPLDFSPPTRELLVHIHNGDSPPLRLDGVQVKQHAVNLLFLAPAAGNYTLLAGNAQAVAPRYDLAAFAGEMRAAAATAVVPGALEPMPHYQPRASLTAPPLPEVPLTGAPLDAQDWPHRQAVQITRPGVQELELDTAALARSRPDFADLRLLRAGNQIPYVLERTNLARSLVLTSAAVPDAKNPAVSIWKLSLPQAGLPVQRIGLTSGSPLFSRHFQLYEKITGSDGRTRIITLASGDWSRTPEPGVPETRLLELTGRPQTDTLWLETDNGDNPAIELGPVQAIHPVVRLVYKVAVIDGYALAYGNPGAKAPRYDLSLVAVKLLTASRNVASLAVSEAEAPSWNPFAGLNRHHLLWVSLALVVVVLLVVVAKLLPKPPAA